MFEIENKILVNDLLVPKGTKLLNKTSIVIHIERKPNQIFVLELGKSSKPEPLPYDEVLHDYNRGEIDKGKFPNDDFWKKLEESINDTARVKRDHKFQIIKPLVDNLAKFLSSRNYGDGLVNLCVKKAVELGYPKTTRYQVNLLLWRYLSCGRNKNAFLRKVGTGKSTNKKYTSKTGPKRGDNKGCNGRMRNETDEKHIRTILNKFHLSASPISVAQCWPAFHHKYQCTEIIDPFTGEVLDYQEKENELHISKHQFRNYADQYVKENRQKVRSAQGLTDEYNKNIRGLSGEVHKQFGDAPGGNYQIDETPLAIELVDEFDRNRRLGRPTCYSVVDMFSRTWVGLMLTFAKASANTAREIVFIACRNKEKFCEEIGVKLNEPWSTEGKCTGIVVDNAEFQSALTDAFSSDANIEVVFNKEGNSQEKGLVERRHKTLEEFLFGRIPGAVSKKYVRDYLKRKVRKDAVLNIRELYQILIDFITRYNNYYPLQTLPLTKEMKEDGVKQIPIQKWNWGIINRPNSLLSIESAEDDLYMRLLETAKVTVKRDGLFLPGKYIRTFKNRKTSKGLKYCCNWSLKESVHEEEVGKTYDCKFMRYSMSKIWIVTSSGLHEANLHPEDESFEWWAAESVQDRKNEEAADNEDLLNQYNKEQGKTVSSAKNIVSKARTEQDDITIHAANSQDLSINRELATEREILESKNQLNEITRENYQEEKNIGDDTSSKQVQLKDSSTNETATLFAEKARMNRRRRG